MITEFRFKPGDRVRINQPYHPFHGFVGVIESIRSGLYKVVVEHGARSAVYWGIDRELELAEEE